jgi:hypothetical protein
MTCRIGTFYADTGLEGAQWNDAQAQREGSVYV